MNTTGSSSSPGLGGLISPFAKTYGLHFTPDMEPQDSIFEMIKESMKYVDKSQPYIEIPDTYEEFIKFKEEWAKDLSEFVRIYHSDNDICYVRIGDEFDGISNTYIMY